MQAEKHQWLQREIALLLLPTKKKEKRKACDAFSDTQFTKGRNCYEYVDGKDTSWANWMRWVQWVCPVYTLRLPQCHTPFLLNIAPSTAFTSSFLFPLHIMLFHFKRHYKEGNENMACVIKIQIYMLNKTGGLENIMRSLPWRSLIRSSTESSRFTRDALTHLTDTTHLMFQFRQCTSLLKQIKQPMSFWRT